MGAGVIVYPAEESVLTACATRTNCSITDISVGEPPAAAAAGGSAIWSADLNPQSFLND